MSFLCTFLLHLASPLSSDWTYVYHYETLVALGNWKYFHLTEKCAQVFICKFISMHMHLLLSKIGWLRFFKAQNQLRSGSCDVTC